MAKGSKKNARRAGSSKLLEGRFLYHRAGSRKAAVHDYWLRNGGESGKLEFASLASFAAGLPIPKGRDALKESTLRAWASDWRGGAYHKARMAALKPASKKAKKAA